jgi:lipopolysaccharide/colanic/teichoic acid biosynthesis glycosyltransferase
MRKPKSKTLKGLERKSLLDKLYEKYGNSPSLRQRIIYWRKKYSWLFIVESTKFLKRLFDIIVGGFFLLLFSPLMLLIAIIIKLNDGGPIIYVSDRVGKWGKEFLFPKFRTMKVGAEKMKEQLLPLSDYKDEITFKMKKDPRITWIGRFLRKSSLDELPQLWCVLKGDMSLVGPRPPLVEEVSLYSLEQRKRLDVAPGLTCIWQVSGRSDIPFSKQVKLDIEYIESQSFWLDLKLLLKTIPAILFGKGAY